MKSIRRNILLNPGPATTTDSVKLAQVAPDICPREKEFGELLRNLQAELVDVVHADQSVYEAVLFCGSGTLCMDVCLNSLLPEGKQVLVIKNGAYSHRAQQICEDYGLPHQVVAEPYDRPVDPASVERALAQYPDIALVYATHHETGSGVLNPIRQIGESVHRHGGVFVVDTISSYAMIPIDMHRDHIDFCMSSAQKGLMAMTGLSFIIGRSSLIKASGRYPRRSYYCNLFMQYEAMRCTGEMRFTPPVQTVYALRQALREYWAEGEEAKWARHLRVHRALRSLAEELGYAQVVRPEWQSGLVLSLVYPDHPGWSFSELHDACYRQGFTIYPGKLEPTRTFRLCSLGAIDTPDIESFAQVFRVAHHKLLSG